MTNISITKAALLILGAAGIAWADTCALSAFNSADTSINLGGTKTTDGNGFALSINGGAAIELKADKGNNFPPNYSCPDDTKGEEGQYGYAYLSNTPKGKLGICLTNIKGIVPGEKFDCENEGGQVFTGTSNNNFYGLGNDNTSSCTITFDC